MPPHVHRRASRGRTRGPRLVVVSPWTVEESIVDLADDDDPGPTRLELDQAGDIFPTFVTADDAKRYIDETDTGYDRLNVAILASAVPADFKAAWALQIAGWKTFAAGARASVGFFNAKAVMDQTDRWASGLVEWRSSFAKAGGNAPGPAPPAPGQGVPTSNATIGDVTGLVVAAGVLAAIVIFGPRLAKE